MPLAAGDHTHAHPELIYITNAHLRRGVAMNTPTPPPPSSAAAGNTTIPGVSRGAYAVAITSTISSETLRENGAATSKEIDGAASASTSQQYQSMAQPAASMSNSGCGGGRQHRGRVGARHPKTQSGNTCPDKVPEGAERTPTIPTCARSEIGVLPALCETEPDQRQWSWANNRNRFDHYDDHNERHPGLTMYESLHERINRLLDSSDGQHQQLEAVLERFENIELRLGDLQLDGAKSQQSIQDLRVARDGFHAPRGLALTLTIQLNSGEAKARSRPAAICAPGETKRTSPDIDPGQFLGDVTANFSDRAHHQRPSTPAEGAVALKDFETCGERARDDPRVRWKADRIRWRLRLACAERVSRWHAEQHIGSLRDGVLSGSSRSCAPFGPTASARGPTRSSTCARPAWIHRGIKQDVKDLKYIPFSVARKEIDRALRERPQHPDEASFRANSGHGASYARARRGAEPTCEPSSRTASTTWSRQDATR